MSLAAKRRLSLLAMMLIAGAVWLTGLSWGLPSRRADPFLFGDHPIWSAREILSLGGGWDPKPTQASDYPRNAATMLDQPRVLNGDDASRAELILRYRLYSYQPDEMVTFRALSRMKPGRGDLDPRMYQYGGLWFYPVGALLKLGSWCGAVHLTTDLAYYVEHPDAFGRFYLVARLYVVAWALVGAWAVHRIAGALCGGWAAALCAMACFALLPVVVNMSHEAKPHLPGVALVLLSVLAAGRFVREGSTRAAVWTGILCGAAMGMILTGAVAGGVLPVMVLLRREGWRKRIAMFGAALAATIFCYFVTNPYVLIQLFRPQSVLASNVANYANFYNFNDQTGAVMNALRLIAEGVSPGILAVASFGLVIFFWRGMRSRFRAVMPLASLLLVPAIATAAQVFIFAAGKPGEYGRFALLTDVALALAAVKSIAVFVRQPIVRGVFFLVLPLCAAPAAMRYLGNFLRDCGENDSRLAEATRLREMLTEDRITGGPPMSFESKDTVATPLSFAPQDTGGPPVTLAITADAAPYGMPPVDLFRWRLVLLPKGMSLDAAAKAGVADVLVQAVDQPGAGGSVIGDFIELPPASRPVTPPTVISWAGKPFRVLARRSLVPQYWQEIPFQRSAP